MLVGRVIVMVVANALLLRVSFGPLGQLVRQMRTIDLLMPGQRIPVAGRRRGASGDRGLQRDACPAGGVSGGGASAMH